MEVLGANLMNPVLTRANLRLHRLRDILLLR
jgi:hypothetical protein